MRTALLIILYSLELAAAAQVGESLGHDGAGPALKHRVEALASATTDAARDSLNELLKSDLRAVLESDSAFTFAFAEVPLSVLTPPDARFRLVTWNVPRTDGSHRYEGLLVLQEPRRRVLFELRDMTERITHPALVELGPDNWYGALYYQVIPVRKGGKTYYTLLGWKGHSAIETRKVIEVLSFRGAVPRFGAPLFGEGRVKQQRVVFAYSFQASMSLNWDEAGARIVCDHLSPMRPDLEGQPAFYGPDLSYDAYVWDKDRWLFQRDVDARDLRRDIRPWNAPPK
ncbi:MAG: hypothetical protein JNM31_05105 [Flavobacteriales bacterium]|nr:hypothetical protein [Flavobacteriales bacterium]